VPSSSWRMALTVGLTRRLSTRRRRMTGGLAGALPAVGESVGLAAARREPGRVPDCCRTGAATTRRLQSVVLQMVCHGLGTADAERREPSILLEPARRCTGTSTDRAGTTTERPRFRATFGFSVPGLPSVGSTPNENLTFAEHLARPCCRRQGPGPGSGGPRYPWRPHRVVSRKSERRSSHEAVSADKVKFLAKGIQLGLRQCLDYCQWCSP
jgi:hypothetical protein